MSEKPSEIDMMEIVPRIAQISTLVQRGHLTDRAMLEAGVALDRPAMSVLVTLRMAGEPLRIGDIAARMQVVGPHVTRQVHELERKKLAHRVADPSDRRARLIELTPAGADAASAYVKAMLAWFTEAMADWSAADRKTFGRLLARFSDDLTARLAQLEADLP